MKKTYIKPENTVAVIEVERMIAESTELPQSGEKYNGSSEVLSREVIQSPDAWEEW